MVQVVRTTLCARTLGSLDAIPSLYPIDANALLEAQPTLIITQDLCQVCAPSSRSVSKYPGVSLDSPLSTVIHLLLENLC